MDLAKQLSPKPRRIGVNGPTLKIFDELQVAIYSVWVPPARQVGEHAWVNLNDLQQIGFHKATKQCRPILPVLSCFRSTVVDDTLKLVGTSFVFLVGGIVEHAHAV